MICLYILIRSIDPCLYTNVMGTNAQQTIYADRLRVARSLVHSPRSFTIPAERSTLGARLSLFCFTQSRRVGSCFIIPSAPVDTLRVKPHPCLRSEHAFRLFALLTCEELAFARCRGFTLHRFVPYRNHAYVIQQDLMIQKVVRKTCTNLMLQKCAGAPRLENCAGTPILTNCSKNV